MLPLHQKSAKTLAHSTTLARQSDSSVLGAVRPGRIHSFVADGETERDRQLRAPALIVVFAILLITPSLAQPPDLANLAIREFQGRVVCIPEEMNRLHKTELPTGHEHIYGFRTAEGAVYTLLRTRLSEALFLDDRVRAKELVLRARLLPKTQILDVSTIRSIKNGVVQDLYYYCVICDIESVSPEECACCQGPVELKEVPLR